jgi:hypothetical protein
MPSRRFTTVLNSVRLALNSVSGVFQELTLAEGETTKRYRLAPYGTFPADDVNGEPIMQVVDREAAVTMAANFASLTTRLATFFRGIPIYEGHADDPDWAAKNPGHRASAVGRIKSIEPGEDGIYVTSVLNSDGIALLSGDAPKYTGHSPLWRLVPVQDRPGHFRPVLLWSDALTNTPNILSNTIALNALAGMEIELELPSPDPAASAAGAAENPDNTDANDDTMKLTPEALAALGFAPDATPSPDEISQAIVQLLSAKATAEADKATADGATSAANSRATTLQSELDLVRGQAVQTVLDDAIATGRITEAQRPAWTTALNTSFISEANKLAALMPVLNTTNRVANLGTRKTDTPAAEGTDALNTAVRDIATANGLNLSLRPDYDRAWEMLRTAKPDPFKR